jgi:hypothetical protein
VLKDDAARANAYSRIEKFPDEITASADRECLDFCDDVDFLRLHGKDQRPPMRLTLSENFPRANIAAAHARQCDSLAKMQALSETGTSVNSGTALDFIPASGASQKQRSLHDRPYHNANSKCILPLRPSLINGLLAHRINMG